MYRSSYLREVRKEKYERTDAYDELQGASDFNSLAQAQGLENLQELNERFANYINRARMLEQRNTIFRKQLETFQRMDVLAGLEEAFVEQIELNSLRIRELSADRAKLEREDKDSQRMLDEYHNKYRNEREYQQVLKQTLQRLNKEADEALLCNLELQLKSQFMHDDLNATKDRYKKNLLEIQTYVSILQQIIQMTPNATNIITGVSEEKLMAERRIPMLQTQLEEYKSILGQLQTHKLKLQTETTMLEQAIKSTQESYDDEVQLYNEQIEILRKEIEDAERTLEKYSNDCHQLVIYQQSLASELERYKRVIENEDNRLNSAIIGTPVSLFSQSYRPFQTATWRRQDITVVMQEIASAKPRQKGLAKKISRRKEITSTNITDGFSPENKYERTLEGLDQDQLQFKQESTVIREPKQEGLVLLEQETVPEDVPDGAQISKAFDELCNTVREKIRCFKRPEPKTVVSAKERYVLVTEEASYDHPCFYSSYTPGGGRIIVSMGNGKMPNGGEVEPITELPEPSEPSANEKGEVHEMPSEPEEREAINAQGRKSEETAEEPSKQPDISGPEKALQGAADSSSEPDIFKEAEYVREDQREGLAFREPSLPTSLSYEKVEMVESIQQFSDDRIQTYEETAMIVETTIEKTSKKKQGDKGS
ncbi:filensin [Carettochelys insculpta]|uniref:filensin n=1 Tax=Carettochelys insculpta TaxID=44489 RepID=UPI003EBC36BC